MATYDLAMPRPLDEQRRSPRSEVAYANLRAAIDTGRFRPGERVRELDVAKWLRMSRTPVRDALQRLEADGVLVLAPRRGLIVAELEEQQATDLYDVRAALEELAARLAARRASESEVAALRDVILRQGETPSHDGAALTRLNQLFHDGIYRATRNRYLIRLRDSLEGSLALLPGWSLGGSPRADEIAEEHVAIVDAIERRDVERAGRLSADHVRRDERVRMRLFRNLPEPPRRRAESATGKRKRAGRARRPGEPKIRALEFGQGTGRAV